jgi:two-component system phosphate regulon response regulator OmpR
MNDYSPIGGPLPRILVIEDDEVIAAFIQEALRDCDLDVTVEEDPVAGLARHARERADLIILDRLFPRGDGLTALRDLRASGDEVPIILLTSKSELEEKLEGLGEGADDYMGKPFSIRELEARVRALLRRARASAHPERSSHGPFTIDWAGMRVERDGEPVDLTPQEFRILALLIRCGGRTLPRMELLEQAWPASNRPANPRTVDVYVTRLRSKLRRESDPSWIRTQDGEGYAWNA